MDGPWYEKASLREQLSAFGRALQGPSPYHVVLEPNHARCRSGYCNFTAQTIVVNPTLFAAPADEQYQLTKALIVHEAAHRRFTVPQRLPSIVRKVANILEDERVERRMCAEFPGVRWHISQLAERFYEQSRTISESSDNPAEVVIYSLQLRWANRACKPVKGSLSPSNQFLWKEVKGLVHEAWQAESSHDVNDCAKRIVRALGLREPDPRQTVWRLC